MKMIYRCINWLVNMCMWVGLFAAITIWVFIAYEVNYSQAAQDDYVYEIYYNLLSQTGQGQDALPLYINEELIDNAYNDGTKIVIYRGLINHSSWDSIALVLGHEIAHGMLGHLGKLNTNDTQEIAVLEANADKMGAVYAMKAGWDVCKGRELFKYWKENHGNALGQDHPDYYFRYYELNFNCGDKF